MPTSRVAVLLVLAAAVLLAAGGFGAAQLRERARSTPDPYEPYRQTVQAIVDATPTLDAYNRGRARVQTMVAGQSTPANALTRIGPRSSGPTLGDVYRCAEAYAHGQANFSWECMDDAVDACVRSVFSSTGGLPSSFQCSGIAMDASGTLASPSQVEDCVRAAAGEASPLASPFLNCRD